MAEFDRDFDFDEDSLREIESNESMLFTQQCSLPLEKSPDENKSPEQKLSSRKNLLLDLFDRPPEVEDIPEESSCKTLLLDLMSRSATPSPPKEREPLKNLLLETMSKKTPNTIRKNLLTEKNDRSPFKRPLSPKPKEPPKTLVRKFPGPAGLLSFSAAKKNQSLSKALNDNLHDSDEERAESRFCSQDTKKLFTDGAWRLMMNELPQDYLTGKDISSIKNLGRSKKIPILAGIIEKIDWSAANPRVTLKDISDSIEGMMHKDIFARYPSVLQPGVVVLLRDVGILNLRGSKASLTTSILFISPISIVAAYNDKSRLITTPELTKLMEQELGSQVSRGIPDTLMDTSDFELDDNLFEGFAVLEASSVQDNLSQELARSEEVPGTTFGDNLLDDSDDEMMSQMQLSPERNDVVNNANGDTNNEDTFGDSDDELLSQLDMDAVVNTYDK
ncbi:GSCOCG00004704001-RA-CDS [Cotesia congregata]|uniref:Similar to Hrob: Homologous recombination OB-fold protein (Mus musculus) n=1 Tax=Cotesia congregata TaxID=51543 RepID=A0A8J2MH38_COTCN|nr:GSCOCG00004704001-RA-CDS [Cotesia congregata]CAG5092137.1 Similar to Hrob: Homologous recombination OB-fold protein (Mus musculus) [Cotesia congregata]